MPVSALECTCAALPSTIAARKQTKRASWLPMLPHPRSSLQNASKYRRKYWIISAPTTRPRSRRRRRGMTQQNSSTRMSAVTCIGMHMQISTCAPHEVTPYASKEQTKNPRHCLKEIPAKYRLHRRRMRPLSITTNKAITHIHHVRQKEKKSALSPPSFGLKEHIVYHFPRRSFVLSLT
jgi:hypothetical protein